MASKRDKIRMQSTESHYFYTTTKNKRTALAGSKLELKGYDPVVRRHVMFREERIKK